MITINTTKHGQAAMTFGHVRPGVNTQATSKKYDRTSTFCSIRFLDPMPRQYEDVFGQTTLNPKDQFNKAKGRELALMRALEEIPGLDNKTRDELISGYVNRKRS